MVMNPDPKTFREGLALVNAETYAALCSRASLAGIVAIREGNPEALGRAREYLHRLLQMLPEELG